MSRIRPICPIIALLELALLPACHSSSSSGDGDIDAGADTDTDTDSDTHSGDAGADGGSCTPAMTGIAFSLESLGGLEFVPGRGYELDGGVLTVSDWGTVLCGAALDDDQIGELMIAAAATDPFSLEPWYGSVVVDGMWYSLVLDLPPCTAETNWWLSENEDESVPAALLQFASLIESIGDPFAEDCPDAGPDGGG